MNKYWKEEQYSHAEINNIFDHPMPHEALFNLENGSAFSHVARSGVNVAGKSNFALLSGILNVLQ